MRWKLPSQGCRGSRREAARSGVWNGNQAALAAEWKFHSPCNQALLRNDEQFPLPVAPSASEASLFHPGLLSSLAPWRVRTARTKRLDVYAHRLPERPAAQRYRSRRLQVRGARQTPFTSGCARGAGPAPPRPARRKRDEPHGAADVVRASLVGAGERANGRTGAGVCFGPRAPRPPSCSCG